MSTTNAASTTSETDQNRPSQVDENYDLLTQALNGRYGEDQIRIAQVGLDFIATLLRKNTDYGGSAWKPPVLAPSLDADSAIRVRMSDKIERIQSLLNRGQALVNESLADTMKDLGAYCILWLSRPQSPESINNPNDKPDEKEPEAPYFTTYCGVPIGFHRLPVNQRWYGAFYLPVAKREYISAAFESFRLAVKECEARIDRDLSNV